MASLNPQTMKSALGLLFLTCAIGAASRAAPAHAENVVFEVADGPERGASSLSNVYLPAYRGVSSRHRSQGYSATGNAHAAPISYSAAGTATLTITNISPTILPGNVFITNAPEPSLSPPIEDTTGNATVMTDGSASGIGDPLALRVGDGYFNDTSASGTADAPAPSSSFAFSLASGQVLIDNENNDVTVTVEFLLSYSLEASASFDNPALEDAFAFADVQLNWEPISGTFDFFSDEADSDDRFGNPTMVDTSFPFSVTVLPGFVGNASLQTASSGNADIFPVPEPGTLSLLGALAGLGMLVRRRR